MLGRTEIQEKTIGLDGGAFGHSQFESRNVDLWRLDSLREPSKRFLEFIQSLEDCAFSPAWLGAWGPRSPSGPFSSERELTMQFLGIHSRSVCRERRCVKPCHSAPVRRLSL